MRKTTVVPALALTCLLFSGVVMAQEAAIPDGPLTLQQCIDIAWARHPDIAIAQMSVQSARANARQQAAQLYPSVDLDWSARASRSLNAVRSTERSAGVSVSYTLYESGLRERIKRSRIQAEASDYGIADARRLLAYEVTTAYYDVLAAHEYSGVTMEALSNAERHREIVQAKIDEGIAAVADIKPIDVEVANARLDAVRSETDLRVSIAGLRALLSLPPQTVISLAGTLGVGAYQGDVVELLDIASENRPDIAQQRLGVTAARYSVKATEATAGLSLDATIGGDWGRYTGDTGESWQASIGASYPLFDAGASRASVIAARADAETTRLQLDAKMLTMQSEVEQAHARLEQAAETIAAAQKSREEAETNLRIAEAKYTEGLAIVIEVTDAQTALTSARYNEVTARYDYATSIATLEKAIGTALETAAGDAQ